MQRERSRFPTCSNITAVTSKLGRTQNNLHTNDCFRDGGSRIVRPQASFLICYRGCSIAPKCIKKAKTATARQQERSDQLHQGSITILTTRWVKLVLNMQQSVRTDQYFCGAQSNIPVWNHLKPALTFYTFTQMCFKRKLSGHYS